MDPLAEHRAWSARQMQLDYERLQGNEFQDKFADLMERVAPGDFVRTTTWGRAGDLKCDGYMTSSRSVFQCYAPRALTVPKTASKMDVDFDGACHHWSEHMGQWVFVHNDFGVPAPLTLAVAKLRTRRPDLVIEVWGLGRMRLFIEKLETPDLRALFGEPPDLYPLHEVGSADVREVLTEVRKGLETLAESPVVDLRPPPTDKITLNKLEGWVRDEIIGSLSRMPLVDRAIQALDDPDAADQIASWLRDEYVELCATRRYRNTEVYEILVQRIGRIAGGTGAANRTAQVVVAYFFERCDIFDRSADASPYQASAS